MDLASLDILNKLSSIYEDLDINSVEERFISLVDDIFNFDRIALFYLKHRRGVLQGKLSRNFSPDLISSISCPVEETNCFTTPLATGAPVTYQSAPTTANGIVNQLQLENFALVPISYRNSQPCWKTKNCTRTDCPAYGAHHLRCWLLTDTSCCNGSGAIPAAKIEKCLNCSIFTNRNLDDVEGLLLLDNTASGSLIPRSELTVLSIIGQAVARAVYNAKLFAKVLNDAIRDPLTGLYNRRHFNERLLDEIDRIDRYGGQFSVIFCDIDHFKVVNDSHGHVAGDAVLVWISSILRVKSRHSDIVARFGGEEFIILLPNCDTATAREVAEKMRRFFAASPFLYKDASISTTLSFGVTAVTPKADKNPAAILDMTDRALYSAKEQGRNRVCVM